MSRPVGYGRPGTPVFPDCWDQHAGKVLATTHDSTVTIGRPGGTPVWSDVRGQTETPAAVAAYDGPASLRPASESDGDTERVVGEDPVTVVRYQVALPRPAAGVEVGHVVHVDASPDNELVGRDLTVIKVEYGDRRFTRLVYATLND